MKRFAPWFLLALVFALAPCMTPAQSQSTTPAAKPATAAHPHSTAPHTDPALLHPATLTAKAPDVYEVTFKTTAGDFVVTVTRAWAPLGADRFYNLVRHGFFTDAAFFRVVPGFIVQFGLSANPAVNKVWDKASIKDDPVTQSNHAGYLTFATAGPNTRTTQLFINLGGERVASGWPGICGVWTSDDRDGRGAENLQRLRRVAGSSADHGAREDLSGQKLPKTRPHHFREGDFACAASAHRLRRTRPHRRPQRSRRPRNLDLIRKCGLAVARWSGADWCDAD